MKHDIELQIRALVAILRQNKVKVWVDFKSMNKSKLSGVYGELCDRFKREYVIETFKLDSIQIRWLKTMKLIS